MLCEMSHPEQDLFHSIVDSLRDDDTTQIGRLIYSSEEHNFPGSNLVGYRPDRDSQYWRDFPEGVLHTCTPMAKNFKLPPDWAEEFGLIKFKDND